MPKICCHHILCNLAPLSAVNCVVPQVPSSRSN